MRRRNPVRRLFGSPRSWLAPLLAGVVTMGMALPASSASAASPPSDAPRAELRGLIENVTQANARRYRATDSSGRSMDAAKIVQESPGHYLAVYHTMLSDGRFHTALSTSTDLMTWTFAHDFGAGSSQPTIARAPDGGYVMAWEQDPSNHVAVRYYPSRSALLNGADTRRKDTVRTLSTCAEGTPNIYSIRFSPDVDHSVIDIGGHYFANCDVDRQMRGTLTNFTSWSATAQPNVDNAMLYWGVRGNIGDRDQVAFRGFPFGLFEGQFTKGDFGSWRTFVYDYQTGNADTTAITTDRGSKAFANPSITALQAPDGRQAILVSLFLPSEGAAPGEAGQLLYYRTF
ncbi:hypothetical protein AB0F77_11005 [Streptomyces sp. NPDC026672]|uniref:hypothetical protein n=1 Tax=unclassified Streptomyces TaxID=2593676 RepID=UPI0033CA3CDD